MPALDPSQFDAIVSEFYRAASCESGWGQALRQVQQAFGARLAVLHTMDLRRDGRLTSLQYGEGPDWAPEAVLHYVREWHRHDPRKQRFLREGPSAIGHWRHCHEAFDDEYARHDRFFSDYLAAYGSRYNSNVVLPVEDQLVSAFVLELPAERGPLDAAERGDADRLGRHLRDALRAHERVRKLAVDALAAQGLLEDFGFPIWLLDGERYVWHANAAARALQAEGRLLALEARRLRACDARADRALTTALQALSTGGHGARQRVTLQRSDAAHAARLLLHTLVPDQVLGAFGEIRMVMATLVDIDEVRTLQPLALADIFDMTPAQSRVASLLADGLSAPQIAARLGCALSTVRTHLRAVLRQLGARRLADAIRLLRQGDALWARADLASR